MAFVIQVHKKGGARTAARLLTILKTKWDGKRPYIDEDFGADLYVPQEGTFKVVCEGTVVLEDSYDLREAAMKKQWIQLNNESDPFSFQIYLSKTKIDGLGVVVKALRGRMWMPNTPEFRNGIFRFQQRQIEDIKEHARQVMREHNPGGDAMDKLERI